ncbi:MAG: hypothetical protein LBN27_01870 [Prevotellaceae bacterium]|jgi:hypothetical protein|nr:hypothetical protein [Prevotellaceae bacterium]
MKKLFLSIGFIACATLIIAQNAPKVTAKWETTFNKNISLYDRYLGEDESSYYFLVKIKLNKWTAGYRVEKYDKTTLKPTESKTFEQEMKIEKVYQVGNETYAYIYDNIGIFDSPDKKTAYEFYKFNKSKMLFEKITQQFAGVKFENFGGLRLSPDQSKLLFVFREAAKKKDTDDSYQLLMVDNQLQKIWEKKTTSPTFADITVDNEGNLYTAYKKYSDKKNYNYILAKYSANGSEKRFTVNMNDYLYQDCHLIASADNHLLVLGYFSHKTDNNKTGGCFFAMNDDFSKAENITFQDIPLDILTLHDKKKLPERYDDYEFNEPLYGENGDVVICSEVNSLKERTHTDIRWSNNVGGSSAFQNERLGYSTMTTKTTQSVRHYFRDVYVFKISGNKLLYMKRVPKDQSASETNKIEGLPNISDKMSYEVFLSGDNVVLIFTDDKKNMKTNENSKEIENIFAGSAFSPLYKYGTLVSVTLDKDGKQTKQTVDISAVRKDNLEPEILNCVHLGNNQAIITARTEKLTLTDCKIGVISIE